MQYTIHVRRTSWRKGKPRQCRLLLFPIFYAGHDSLLVCDRLLLPDELCFRRLISSILWPIVRSASSNMFLSAARDTFLNGEFIRFVFCSVSTVHTSGPPHSVAFPLKLEKRNLTCLLTGVPLPSPLPPKFFLFPQGCGIAGLCRRYHDGFSQLRLQKTLLNTFFRYVKYCPGSTWAIGLLEAKMVELGT